jgi:ribosomal protein S16
MAHKKGHRADARNYRPISMIITLAKLTQTLVYDRINKRLSDLRDQGHDNIADTQYGARKGRDRWALLATLKLVMDREARTLENGGCFNIISMDVSGAYPEMDAEGADQQLLKWGITGKLWRFQRLLEAGQRGVIITSHGHSKPQTHHGGVSQGGVGAGNKWTYGVNPIMLDIRRKAKGIMVMGAKYVILGYVDDLLLLAPWQDGPDPTIGIVTDATRRRGSRIAKQKTKWLPVQLKGQQPNPTAFAETKLDPKTQVTHLGLSVRGDNKQSFQQIKQTTDKAKASAAMIKWLGCYNPKVSPKKAEIITDALVTSVLIAGMTLTQFADKKQWNRAETVKAQIGKAKLGVPTRTSTPPVYADLGWTSAKASITRAQMALTQKIIKGEAGQVAAAVIEDEWDQCQEGSYTHYVRTRLDQIIYTGTFDDIKEATKTQWKKLMTKLTSHEQLQEWQDWMDQHGQENNNIQLTKQEWGLEKYLGQMDARKTALMAAYRMGSLSIRGNKTNITGNSICRLCGNHRETETHLLLECEHLEPQRTRMWTNIREELTEDQFQETMTGPTSALIPKLTGGGTEEYHHTITTHTATMLQDIQQEIKNKTGQEILANPWDEEQKWWEAQANIEKMEEIAQWMSNRK